MYETATPLLGGLALVENALDQTAEIHVLDAAGIGAAPERALLDRARELIMRLPLWPVDVLVLQRDRQGHLRDRDGHQRGRPDRDPARAGA